MLEHKVLQIEVNPKFKETIDQLTKDGWQLNPSIPPVATCHLIREAPPMGVGELTIDESKITILRKDGTLG